MHSLLHNFKIGWAYVGFCQEGGKRHKVIGQNKTNLILGTILIGLLVFYLQGSGLFAKNAVSRELLELILKMIFF